MFNSFYTTDNKVFKSQWGVVVDDFKLEFIENGIILDDPDELFDSSNNNYPFIDESPFDVEDYPSFINNMTINGHLFEQTVYFNDRANLSLFLRNNEEVNSVKIHINRILENDLIITGYSKNLENQQNSYLDSSRLTYSFYDGYTLNGTFYYENVMYWNGQEIPLKDLNIIGIDEVITEQGIPIPFRFDPIAQEITIDERYSNFLNRTTNLLLKGVTCDLGWQSSLSFNGETWELNDFNVLEFITPYPEWYEFVYGFQNLNQSTKNSFVFDFILEYSNGSKVYTPLYGGKFDTLKATGSFGQILPNSLGETKSEYWILGKTSSFGNIMFGTANPEHRTLYFTPGYVKDNVYDNNFYVEHEHLLLHNIKAVEIYNRSDELIGCMTLSPTSEFFPYYALELNSNDFNEEYNWIYARIVDKADNVQIKDVKLYVYKEKNYTLHQAVNFGDKIFYDQNQNYSTNPHQFN